jgi:predicted dehydrogenase
MLEACKRNKALLVLNHQRRFDPNHRRLQQAIADGKLGDLLSAHVQWAAGRLGNVGTHVFDGLAMLTRRRFEAVSGTLDMAGKPDCRGANFHDPGGWGTLQLEGGLMATVNAPDYAKTPFYTEINGTKGRAYVRGLAVTLEDGDGRTENWPAPSDGVTSMDRALTEIIDHLDGRKPFAASPADAVHIFETIVGFHASHARGAAWTKLPLSGTDREIEIQTG